MRLDPSYPTKPGSERPVFDVPAGAKAAARAALLALFVSNSASVSAGPAGGADVALASRRAALQVVDRSAEHRKHVFEERRERHQAAWGAQRTVTPAVDARTLSLRQATQADAGERR
jgi:hypothetical protein